MKGRKKVATKTLAEHTEIVLKNNIFQFNEKTLKQLRSTAIDTTFSPFTILYW